MPASKILVIEDDADVRMGLGIRLKANHYQVHFAPDARSGLAEAEKCKPDLVILDLGLPGESGYTVLNQLAASAQLHAIPVIVLSARDRRIHEPRVRAAGAKVFCQKPVQNDELLAKIRQLLADDASATLVQQ
jgi:DNA-binding response OmpR family regulator